LVAVGSKRPGTGVTGLPLARRHGAACAWTKFAPELSGNPGESLKNATKGSIGAGLRRQGSVVPSSKAYSRVIRKFHSTSTATAAPCGLV